MKHIMEDHLDDRQFDQVTWVCILLSHVVILLAARFVVRFVAQLVVLFAVLLFVVALFTATTCPLYRDVRRHSRHLCQCLGDDYDDCHGYDDGSRYQDLGTVATTRR